MAERRALPSEIIIRLLSKVSEAAREKLAHTYNMGDFTAPVVAESEIGALLRIIRHLPRRELHPFAETLHRKGQLGSLFLLRVLDDGFLAFFEEGMGVRASIPGYDVHKLICLGGESVIRGLCRKAGIPVAFMQEFHCAILNARSGESALPQAERPSRNHLGAPSNSGRA